MIELREKGAFSVLVFMILLLLNHFLVPSVIAPPILAPYTTGFISYSSYDIEVPETRSNISVASEKTSISNYTHTIAFHGELELKNQGEQNSSIVVAYPDRWYGGAPIPVIDYQITYNIEGNPDSYNAVRFGSADNITDLPGDLAWLSSNRFEAINITLDTSAEVTLKITALVQITVLGEYFHFRCGLDDGVVLKNSTHSVIQIEIPDTTKFHDCTFTPSDSLTISQPDESYVGTWDFIMSDFNQDFVEVVLQQGVYYPPSADDVILFMTVSISLVVVYCAISLLIKHRPPNDGQLT